MIAAGLASWLFAGPGWAQDGGPPLERAAPEPAVTVGVEIRLDPAGALTEARVIASSGDPALDEAALVAVRALTFAPGPTAGTLDVQVGVAFTEVVPRPPLRTEPGATAVLPAPEEIVVVAGDPEPPDGEVLDRREIQVLPGSNGDVIRAVLNLPGVARPTLGVGQPVIRGTAPEDSGYYLDGARVPLVFHFGGLSTVLNSDAVERLVFLPGNQGVRYGRILGGAVDVLLDDDLPERSRGYAAVDLFQSTLFAETRLGARRALTVSGRRSYADLFLNPLLKGRTAFDVRVPRYYDAQVRLLNQTRRGTFDVLLLVSDDRFQLLEPDAEDGEDATVQIGLATRFAKLRLLSRATYGAWHQETSVLGGPERQAFELIGGSAVETPVSVGLRHEWTRDEGPGGLSLRLGFDGEAGRYAYRSVLPAVGGIAASESETVVTWRALPGAYLEPSLRRGSVTVVPGIRADGMLLAAGHLSSGVDPRLAVRYDRGGTVLRASAGGYSQPPTVRQAIEQPEIGALRSWQLAVGAERELGQALTLGVTAYANELRWLVTGREDAFDFFTGPPLPGPVDTSPYANRGFGRVRGLEGLLRWSDDRTTAWLSATLSRSVRISPGEDPRKFAYDQPVVLTAIGSRALPRGWRVGLRGRFTSGNPYAPVVNSYLDLEQQAVVPMFGAPDAARMPAFWSIDARVDKDWALRAWTLTTYLDLQNATNHRNVELMAWTEDYREEAPILGLPILPAFGVRGAW